MRTGLCIIAFRWGFLWGTSLGSKPCSDSCLVNHLNKFSNKVPTSEVKKFPPRRREAQHRTPSTKSSRAKFSVNNTRVIVQVALPSQDGRINCLFWSNLIDLNTQHDWDGGLVFKADRHSAWNNPSVLLDFLSNKAVVLHVWRVTSPRQKKKNKTTANHILWQCYRLFAGNEVAY